MLLMFGALGVIVVGALLLQRGRRRAVATVAAGILAIALVGAGVVDQAPPALAATAAAECVPQETAPAPAPDPGPGPSPEPTRAIVAVDDELGEFTTVSGGTSASVLANDTLGGAAATPGTVTVTGVSVPAGLTVNADGTVTVPSAQAPGAYTVGYQICETAVPANCANATATLSVVRPIVANPDDLGTLIYVWGQPVTSTVSVLDNDLLDGVPVSLSTITFFPEEDWTNISWNDDGTITIEGVIGPDGEYTQYYQICETADPSNCATGTLTFTYKVIFDSP